MNFGPFKMQVYNFENDKNTDDYDYQLLKNHHRNTIFWMRWTTTAFAKYSKKAESIKLLQRPFAITHLFGSAKNVF